MGILLFNLAGYRILSGLLQDRAGMQLQSRVDKQQYDRTQLILVKVSATHLSYYNPSTEFERVDGQIEIGGVPCQYVERRIFNDSLEFLCLPNQAALKIRTSGEDYFKLVNDKQPDSKPGIQKSFAGDPYMLTEAFRFSSLEPGVVFVARPPVARISAITLAVDERPPVFVA